MDKETKEKLAMEEVKFNVNGKIVLFQDTVDTVKTILEG